MRRRRSASLTTTTHGNGFWNTGFMDRSAAAPLPASGQVKIDRAGHVQLLLPDPPVHAPDGDRQLRLRATALVALTGAAACAAAPVAFASGPMVSAQFDSFAPPQITALAGETVMWMNDSARAHTVTANDGSFDSDRIPVSGMYEHQFTNAGAYAYHCTLHPFMTGEVDVYDLLLNAPAAPAGARRPYRCAGARRCPAARR